MRCRFIVEDRSEWLHDLERSLPCLKKSSARPKKSSQCLKESSPCLKKSSERLEDASAYLTMLREHRSESAARLEQSFHVVFEPRSRVSET